MDQPQPEPEPAREFTLKLRIDPDLLRHQRLWLLEHRTQASEGLTSLLDEVADQMEAQGERRQLLTDDDTD